MKPTRFGFFIPIHPDLSVLVGLRANQQVLIDNLSWTLLFHFAMIEI